MEYLKLYKKYNLNALPSDVTKQHLILWDHKYLVIISFVSTNDLEQCLQSTNIDLRIHKQS